MTKINNINYVEFSLATLLTTKAPLEHLEDDIIKCKGIITDLNARKPWYSNYIHVSVLYLIPEDQVEYFTKIRSQWRNK